MWKRRVLLRAGVCASALGASLLAANPAPEWADLVGGALARNREIMALRERVREARSLSIQAGLRPAPTLEFETSSGRPLGTAGKQEYSAGYSYLIETAGKRQKRMRIARAGVDLAQAELAERTRQLTFDIKALGIDAVTEREKLGILKAALGFHQESLRLTEARVQEGDAPRIERDLLAVEVARTRVQVAAARGRADALLLAMRGLLGLPPDAALHLPAWSSGEATVGTSLEELRHRGLEQRPDLRLLRLTENQGTQELDLAKAQLHPDVTVSGRYSHREESFGGLFGVTAGGIAAPIRDRDNLLSIGVSMPLFTGRRNRANVEAADARGVAARLRREHLERQIAIEIEAAWRRIEAARQTVAVFEGEVIAPSEKNLAVIREAYTLGQLRMLDVLNEQRRLLDTQLTSIDAKAELARTVAELERAVGGGL